MPKKGKKKQPKKEMTPEMEEVLQILEKLDVAGDYRQKWVEDDYEGIKKSVVKVVNKDPEEKRRHIEAMAKQSSEYGLRPLNVTHTETKQPAKEICRAACDYCGAERGGRHRCSRCESVFYCNGECQKADYARHKRECQTLKEVVRQRTQQACARLDDLDMPFQRIEAVGGVLEMEAAWQLAVSEFELFPKIRNILVATVSHKDTDEDIQNYASSTMQHLLTSFFRGQRRRTDGGYNKMDGTRLSSFFQSSEDAAKLLFQAGLRTIPQAAHKDIVAVPRSHAFIHRSARDVIMCLNLAAAREDAARAIFFWKDENAVERTEWLAGELKKYLFIAAALSDAGDPNSVLEGLLNQLAAILAYWVDEFAIPCDFQGRLGLAGSRKARFECMALPLGTATAKAGRQLTSLESRAAMAHLRHPAAAG